MSEVRLLLRSVLLLCAAILLGTCAAHDRSIMTGSPCKSMVGDSNRNAPIVCVNDDAKTLSVSHNEIRAHHVTASGRVPVVIHWYTKSGTGPLAIDIEDGCVTDMQCTGGNCKAKTVPVTSETRCKYTVEIKDGNHDPLDPDVVVVPCC